MCISRKSIGQLVPGWAIRFWCPLPSGRDHFSFVIGIASTKVCIGALLKHQRKNGAALSVTAAEDDISLAERDSAGGGSLRGKSAAAARLSVATSRYDYDDLHHANPLVLGTRTGRPSDAPVPLCLCRRPLLPSHVPAQSPGEWLPTIRADGGFAKSVQSLIAIYECPN
jgi:hypothetical protein